MCFLMTCRAEYAKVLCIITVEQIGREMQGVQLKGFSMLPAFWAAKVCLFAKGALQCVHLVPMYDIQADMEEKADQRE